NVCILALKVEKQIKTKSKGSTSRVTPPTRTASPIGPKIAPKATTPTTSIAGNTRERVDNAPRCYKCSGLGHYARDYLNLKTLAFVPDDTYSTYDTDTEPEVDKPGDELVYPDRGEALGKICDMIIDGGSCENVVSTYMVDKLGMKTETLSYAVFYCFKKDGVNITLVPFDSHQTQAEGSNLFMKKTNFEGLPMLKEFADAIPDDIPPGLPALRDIQHCIDFIPCSTISNRPAYRMNLKEFAKLQRQVTKFLEKGLIRESMSPCAVPA
ncbi:hypothetical protein Tco_0056087, partial [Tanacetum coccineum]